MYKNLLEYLDMLILWLFIPSTGKTDTITPKYCITFVGEFYEVLDETTGTTVYASTSLSKVKKHYVQVVRNLKKKTNT